MQIPSIHLNGTGLEALETQYQQAYDAMSEALRKLQDAAPNARDYYVQGPEAYPLARAEHVARMEAVAAVCEQLQALLVAVADVRAERDERRRQRDRQQLQALAEQASADALAFDEGAEGEHAARELGEGDDNED